MYCFHNMIAVLATVQILHVQWLCDGFGYYFLRNIFLSIKILKTDKIHDYSVFVWPWKLTLKQIIKITISSFIFGSLNFDFGIPESGQHTLQNWASGGAQCKCFCLAVFLGIEMLMDLLWFRESPEKKAPVTLGWKDILFYPGEWYFSLNYVCHFWGRGKRSSILREQSTPIHQHTWLFLLSTQTKALSAKISQTL